jgi:hypothetical protein
MLKTLTTTCLAALTAAAITLAPSPATAQFEGRSVDEVVQVSLIEGWRMENGRHMAGIRIALAPGMENLLARARRGRCAHRSAPAVGRGHRRHGHPLAEAGGVLHQRHAVDRLSGTT